MVDSNISFHFITLRVSPNPQQNIHLWHYLTTVPRPRTLPPRVELVVPRVLVPRPTPPRPRRPLVCCDVVPLPRVDVVGTVVFLRIPRPRVGVFAGARDAASSLAFSASAAF